MAGLLDTVVAVPLAAIMRDLYLYRRLAEVSIHHQMDVTAPIGQGEERLGVDRRRQNLGRSDEIGRQSGTKRGLRPLRN